jgi:Domain of unknown function (DUF4845)
MKHQQHGITFLGLLVVGVVVGLLAVVAAQVAPTVIEYQAIQKAVNRAAEGTTVAEVRGLYDKTAQIDDISSVKSRDLVISKENDRVVVEFAYEREIHLAGPAYLVLKYAGRSK